MTLSDRASSLRARKQATDGHPAQSVISGDASRRPALRLIPGATQVDEAPQPPAEDHAPLNHAADLAGALDGHSTTATHPPTVVEAAANLWPARDEVRHGLAGQLGSAAAGLVQLLGLSACWFAAHALFSTKTKAAIFALLLVVSLFTCSIAIHA